MMGNYHEILLKLDWFKSDKYTKICSYFFSDTNETLKKKDFEVFFEMWSVGAKGRKNKIRSRYDEIQKRIGQGFDYRTCMKSMLTSDEVERNASLFKRKGVLKICIIKIRDKYASSQTVYLKFEGKNWRIDSW